TNDEQAHRALLQIIMLNNGFKNYSREWWHFTLKDEPFPKTYFNFPVK
ncbi:MAG: M15 family metallopeptidase, partial [candidate division Zixibacteria bacterium]|nr:M15 family metallopeptidase [candidate division Zixibacteria bacterium]